MTESTASTLEETSLTSPPPTPSEGKSVYRSTFAAMNMRITEGFLQHHPALHKDVKEIIAPTRCISAEMKDKFPQMEEMSDAFFYPTGERPSTVHPRQADVVEYIFERRPREMHFQGDPTGKPESKWAESTKQSIFLPLFDPRSEMNTIMGDVQLEYPSKLAAISKDLTARKPDVVFGSRLDASQYNDPVYKDEPPSVYSLDNERLESLLSVSEFCDLSCGAISEKFCFPTFAIERKSDNGSCFLAQNQLIQTLRCMLEAQWIAKGRINTDLPVLALGIVNVGNWVEFWAAWPNDEDDDRSSIYVWHISDYHLFNVRGCVEFISMAINVHGWMYRYQSMVHKAVMLQTLPTDIPSPVTPRKRPHGPDSGNGRESKRRMDKDPYPSPEQLGDEKDRFVIEYLETLESPESISSNDEDQDSERSEDDTPIRWTRGDLIRYFDAGVW